MSSEINIEVLTSTDAQSWDRYVRAHAGASFFHLSGWRTVLESALSHPTYFLYASDAGAIVGVLPLVHVKSFLFGNVLSSLGFGAYGGALADDKAVRDALEKRAVEIGHELGVGVVEFRYRSASGKERPTKDLYERFIKPIEASEEQNMKAIRSKQRNVIRKGIKNGLELKVDSVDSFYDVYAESVRNLGTPVFPKALFHAICETFSDETEILTAHLDGEAVSSALVYYFNGEVCPYYWGGRFSARRLNGNDYLAWMIMCRAAERGCKVFDFGRSKRGTGAFKWKENLGFTGEPLFYEFELVNDSEIPDVNPLNPKYRLFIDMWKRLPLGASKLIGPILAKNLG